MIKTLQLLYQPDIDYECKDNIQRYLENLYFSEDDSIKQKDFVYNSIKNFAEMNQQAYQTSNLIELMNSIVQDRRGEIFAATDGASDVKSRGFDRDAAVSKQSHNDSLQANDSLRRTGQLRKSIMQTSANKYANNG